MIEKKAVLSSWFLWLHLLLLNSANQLVDAQENVCLMIYQMADNNLEFFIRNDNEELINSCAIREESLTTWVYFDGRLQTGSVEDIWRPLVDLYEKNGSKVTSKYTGSRYLTYDHDENIMYVDTKLGELDSDIPQTVFDFVQHAMLDCISKGATEYVLVFSSHGGINGFGGDEDLFRKRNRQLEQHKNRQHYRHLTQSHWFIRYALEQVLETTPGAPSKFDVIGFDACLMSSLTAYAEYAGITKYYIASEATEPGHGWAYEELCNVDSALDLAKDIHDNFLSEPQGPFHQAPKTMALMETTKFENFYTAMENLADELTTLLDANNDPDFFALLQRSRASSISFDSVFDHPGTETPSAVDIGSFFESFDFQCNPKSNTQLRSYLDEAMSTYNNIFIKRGNGPGTADATGMQVMWPFKKTYKSNQAYFDAILFSDDTVVDIAPNWFEFISNYYSAVTPSFTEGNVSSSVCSKSATGGSSSGKCNAASYENSLFSNHELYQQTSQITVTACINIKVDYVATVYGIDASQVAYQLQYRSADGQRQLKRATSTGSVLTMSTLRSLYNLMEKSTVTMASSSNDNQSITRRLLDREWSRAAGPHARHHHQSGKRKKLAEDYLFLFGGSLEGSFDGPSYTSVWDKYFYAIGDVDNFTPIFMRGEGGGTFSISVFYFPEGIAVTPSMFDYDTTPEEAVTMGGIYGAIFFGIDEVTNILTAFTLMTNEGTSVSETPSSAGGHIVPILTVEGQVGDRIYTELIGGVDGTVLDWNEDQNFDLFFMNSKQYSEYYGFQGSSVVIDMFAYDFDAFFDLNNFESESFDMHSFYIDPSEPPITPLPTNQPSAAPTFRPSMTPSTLPTTDGSSEPSTLPTVDNSSEPSLLSPADSSSEPSTLPSIDADSEPSALLPADSSSEPSTPPARDVSSEPYILPTANDSSKSTSTNPRLIIYFILTGVVMCLF